MKFPNFERTDALARTTSENQYDPYILKVVGIKRHYMFAYSVDLSDPKRIRDYVNINANFKSVTIRLLCACMRNGTTFVWTASLM